MPYVKFGTEWLRYQHVARCVPLLSLRQKSPVQAFEELGDVC